MRRQIKMLKVDSEDLRIAKGIAGFKGMTIIDYFGQMVDREAKEFHMEMRAPVPAYRRRKP